MTSGLTSDFGFDLACLDSCPVQASVEPPCCSAFAPVSFGKGTVLAWGFASSSEIVRALDFASLASGSASD